MPAQSTLQRYFSESLSRANSKPTTKVLLVSLRTSNSKPTTSLFRHHPLLSSTPGRTRSNQPSGPSPTFTKAKISANTCRPNTRPTPAFPNQAHDVSAIFGPTFVICLCLLFGMSSVCLSAWLSVSLSVRPPFPVVWLQSVGLPVAPLVGGFTGFRPICLPGALAGFFRSVAQPAVGVLPVVLPSVGLSHCRVSVCRSVCRLGGAWLPVVRSAGLFSLLDCRSLQRPVGQPVCLPVGWWSGIRPVGWLSVDLSASQSVGLPSVCLANLVWLPVDSSVGLSRGRLAVG